jgi:hypothetical protein
MNILRIEVSCELRLCICGADSEGKRKAVVFWFFKALQYRGTDFLLLMFITLWGESLVDDGAVAVCATYLYQLRKKALQRIQT